MRLRLLPLLVALAPVAAIVGCRTGLNYGRPEGPRYSGGTAPAVTAPARVGDTLRVVTFNIQLGRRIDSALVVLTGEPALRGADILLLQEMDEAGTQRIAAALRMAYVYYPASVRRTTHREFGNAVLSRWPIVADAKLVLPHIGRLARTERTATAATIRLGDSLVRVYSTHLGTFFQVGGGGRRDQLRAILADAERFPRVILGGDMNSAGVGQMAVEAGYAWPTRGEPHTDKLGSLDHIFVRGLDVPAGAAAGTVLANHHASDHRPVWARVILRR